MRLEIFGDIHACSEMSFICHMAYNSLCQKNGFLFLFLFLELVLKSVCSNKSFQWTLANCYFEQSFAFISFKSLTEIS